MGENQNNHEQRKERLRRRIAAVWPDDVRVAQSTPTTVVVNATIHLTIHNDGVTSAASPPSGLDRRRQLLAGLPPAKMGEDNR